MNDEQRKAAVEKAAIVLAGDGFRRDRRDVTNVDALTDEEIWQRLVESSKAVWRKRAQAALASVHHFELVEAAEALVTAYGKHELMQGRPELHMPPFWSPAGKCIDTELVVALEAALKEVR